MATVTNSLSIKASLAWTLQATNAGFGVSKQGPDSLSYSQAPSAATWTEVFLAKYSLAASGTQTVDLRSFTDLLSTSVTATGIIGLLIKATATATGGVLRLEPGASNPLAWPLTSGTSPQIDLKVGTAGACMLFAQGVSTTIDATHRNLKISEAGGAQAIVVYVSALVSTA